MTDASSALTFLFSDIEGSTRIWEQAPERMQIALARHDEIARAAVERHRGHFVKSTGDGIHAAFEDAVDALRAVLQIQQALSDPNATHGLALAVRCGLHRGETEHRDNDFFGRDVNRAARIMSAAHGGQTLLSQAVADRVANRLPDGVQLRDLGLVRLRDLTQPEHVYQMLHEALRAEFPPLRSLEATPNNLSQQLNTFIGREHELAEVKQLLTQHRLLTLLGVGGIGKTRLSVQLAADVLDAFPDGVWFVDLAPVDDPRLVEQALASVLGVKEEAGHPVLEALLRHVRDRTMLVILDNCEHLVHACAALAKGLLQAGATLRILASSREVLRVAGERAYHVPALSVPPAAAGLSPALSLAALTRHDAVRLFVDRATASQPAFQLNERSAAAVADICHRLDGIPLAIELAAARVRALSVDAIATRLKDSFRLLATTDQTVLPRQRTLRILIDWSHDLLSAPERTLFARLSVFANGWTLAAAEAVAADATLDADAVLEALTLLVEKSLVAMDPDGARYRLLETVRQYAREKLDAAPDAAATRDRHAAFALALAEEARAGLAGPARGRWLARLDHERENLLAAHAWCDHAANGAAWGLRLVFALRQYCINRGLLALGLGITLQALQRAGAQVRNLDRCRGLFGAGQLSYVMGRYADARVQLEESLAIAREIGDAEWMAKALQPLGMACFSLGDAATARVYLEEGVSLARAHGNPREIAAALNALAQLHRGERQLALAQPLYESCLALSRDLGDQEFIAMALLNLSMVAVGSAASERAVPMLVEVLTIARGIGSQPAAQCAIEVTAGLCVIHGCWDVAARLFAAAKALAQRTGIQRDAVDAAFLDPLMANVAVELGAAAFAEHEASGGQLTVDQAIADALAWLQRVPQPAEPVSRR